jgi:acyl-CoA thioesterase YciA
MDLAGLGLAQETADSRATTVAIEAMKFMRPVNVGDFICCYGELVKVGRSSMKIKIEVYAIGHRETERRQVTEGLFTYVAIDESGKPIAVSR